MSVRVPRWCPPCSDCGVKGIHHCPGADPPLPRFIPYEIPLRPELGTAGYARLVLPSDLTTTEAERLCEVIRAVAFEDATPYLDGCSGTGTEPKEDQR